MPKDKIARGSLNKFLLCSTMSLAMLPLGSNPAWAQDSGRHALEEITVTAQRREQSLRDVPISVTAFSEDLIARANFQSVDDYFSVTPNVSFTSSGSRDRKELSIRGITNQLASDNNIRPNTFGFYIDEFNVAAGTSNPQVVDIERIEILRGPQGTYYGRNAVGGAINITTNQPKQEFELEGSIGYSSFDTIDTHAIINVPVISDKLAVRLVGRFTESDGNIKNINPVGGGNDSTYKYGKGIVRFTPNESLTIDLTAAYTHEKVGMREGVPSGVLAPFSEGLYGSITNVAIPDGVGFWPENTNRVNFNRPQSVGTEWYYLTGRIRYDAESFSIVSITGYIDSKSFIEGDIDGSSHDLFYETKPISRDSLSQELRVQSQGDGPLDWSFGVMAARDRGDTNQVTWAGADNPFALPEGFAVTSTFSDAKSESYAVFGEAVWHVNERLSLTLGGRYTHEKQDVQQYNTSSGVINSQVDDSASFDDFSPRVSVGYVLSDDMNAYATVSRGFKAGGVQINPILADNSYDSEVLWNYEVGVKGEFFNRRLRINTALFYMDWKDLQTEFAFGVVDQNNVISFESGIQNAASARSYGVELEAQALLTPNFTVGGGLGYLNAKFDQYEGAFVEGRQVDLSGAQIPNSPKWTLNANAEYTVDLSDEYSGFIRAEWFYRSGIVANTSGLIFTGFPWEVPGYNSTNLRVGVQNEKFSLTGYVENLFDKKYYTNAYEKAFIGGIYLEPSKQVFGARLTMKIN